MLFNKEALNPESEAAMNEKIGILDTILSRSTYAAGDRLTIADIALIASLSLPEAFDHKLDSYKTMSVVLYGMEWCPACQAVLLTCAAVGIDVRLKNVDVVQTHDNNTESYLQMNPAHSIPTLDDNGFNIWESRAILSYLVEQYAKDDHLYPKDPKRRAMVDNVLFFDNGSLYTSFLRYFVSPIYHKFAPWFPMVITNAAPDKEDEERIIDTLTILDTVLSRNAYAAGDRMTIADISLIASLTLPTVYGYQLDRFENIVRWQAKVQSEIPHYDEVGRKSSEKLKDLVRSRVSNESEVTAIEQWTV